MWVHHAPLPDPPPVQGSRRGGGTNASAAATWRFEPRAAGGVFFASYDRPGMYMRVHADRVVLDPQGTPFVEQPPLAQVAGGTHLASFERVDAPGEFLSSASIEAPPTASAGGLPLTVHRFGGAEGMHGASADAARAATFVIERSTEEYPALAFWARPPGHEADAMLFYPLNEIIDERYNAYMELQL